MGISKGLLSLHNDFLEDLEIGQGRSARTAANYDHYLKAFYTQENTASVSDITIDSVRSFRRWLNEKANESEGVSLATQNYYFIALRQFLKYLAKRDIPALAPEKVELAKLPEREIDVLYPEEVDDLLTTVRDTKTNTPEDALSLLRDVAILELLFSTGMRVSELTKLDRDDIREETNELPITGKGNRVRVVFLSDSAQEAIGAYLSARKDMDPALFIRHKKGSESDRTLRLTSRSIQRMIKKYATAAGITKAVSPHTLRHSFATDLLSNGADVREVQQLLGHASITTTQIYTHLTDVRLREVHERFHRRSE